MPKKTTSITTGTGSPTPNQDGNVKLTGAGMAGAGPNIGGEDADHPSDLQDGLALLAAINHEGSQGAHPASAITVDGIPDVLYANTVDGALDELAAAVPEKPFTIGNSIYVDAGGHVSGIPDWGKLKLNDSSVFDRHTSILDNGNRPVDIFPYYLQEPTPTNDAIYTPKGADPATDSLWNSRMTEANLLGAGAGACYAGGFSRGGDQPAGDPYEVMRTTQIMLRPVTLDASIGNRNERQAATVSGVAFPADRGVLALLHFPASARGEMATEFLGQPLITPVPVGAAQGPTGRVVAAILLGQGVIGSGCASANDPCDVLSCDGGVGGIFAVGVDANSKYDPFAFPGRASGQYDLNEIHNGVNNGTTVVALQPPFDDLDGDLTAGWKRNKIALRPTAAQVRLGTDPTSGMTAVDWGIPVLGGTLDAYNGGAEAPIAQNGSRGKPMVGDSLIMDSNFFRYRLPVLKDYSRAGLKWTPKGLDPLDTRESFRFFDVALPFTPAVGDVSEVAADGSLVIAGNYQPATFTEDYWMWQVARYRHTFLLPSRADGGAREEVGSYWMVHFKKEADFEAFVRDGVMPWDATDGYEIYSASLVNTTGIEEDANVVNMETSDAVPAPAGPAPYYGHTAMSHHAIRSTVFMDPDALDIPTLTTSQWNWDEAATDIQQGVVYVSGVAYFTPTTSFTSGYLDSFRVISLNAELGSFWKGSFRTSDDELTAGVAPAILSSPTPVLLNLAPFSYEDPPNLTLTLGAAGVNIGPAGSLRRHRLEVPFTHIDKGAGTYPTDAAGPDDADTAIVDDLGNAIGLVGDITDMSFSRDVQMQLYVRRPVGHLAWGTSAMQYSANGGHGYTLAKLQTEPLLLFSGSWENGIYGNLKEFGGVTELVRNVFHEVADTSERFFDEVYRYPMVMDPANLDATFGPGAEVALEGPGMGAWAGGPLYIPVRAGATSGTVWGQAAWLVRDLHEADLPVAELQVSGLPFRNPPLSDGVLSPYPASGMLLYPQHLYAAAVKPDVNDRMGMLPQPDYSAYAGMRGWIRAFDAGFSRNSHPQAAGQRTLKLRLDGITLRDFAFAAPGPGQSAVSGLAVGVKVPGLTTWMDAGRQDGAGPGKQDVNLDGAGCLVVGPNTYDFVHPETGMVGCYVEVHFGPAAATFAVAAVNASPYTDASGPAVGDDATSKDEQPVMVRVLMDKAAEEYNLEQKWNGAAFDAAKQPGYSAGEVRGLTGISVVHPDDVLIAAT